MTEPDVKAPSRTPRAAAPRAGDEVLVTIDRLAYGGQGVGRVGSFVVFVEGTVPGDVVRARLRRVRRRFGEAEAVAIETPGPQRTTPRCRHFREDRCGGCAWQQLDYRGQLAAKEEIVRDSLVRLGGFVDPPLRPILAAPSPWFFRNKMEFAFQADGGLGLHPKGRWDQIFRLEECFLESELAVALVKAARAFAEEEGLSLYEPRAREGLLRELVVRQARNTGEIMIGIVTSPGPFPKLEALADRLAALDSGIVSVVRAIRSGASDGSPIQDVSVVRGRATITETLRGLGFHIGLQTFFQTNTAQAESLLDAALALAGPLEGALAIDVYCGVGAFSLALAQRAREVAGVEVVAASIEAARDNAARNGITNARFYCGDARLALPEVLAKHGPPRVVLLDPPRAGAGGKVMRRIARAAPERIVYVSCNPTTLARDLRELLPFGYRLTAVQPVDLFPQTYHVETVVGLERTESASPAPEEADVDDDEPAAGDARAGGDEVDADER